MTRKDSGNYGKKHSPNLQKKPEVVEALKRKSSGGEISCAAAFKIAEDLGVSPAEAGFTIDSLEIKLVKCQMGLYGYGPRKRAVKPMNNVPEALEEAIKVRLKDSKLSCKAAWEIAEKLGIGKMDVASACETLKIKISSCQLGAF